MQVVPSTLFIGGHKGREVVRQASTLLMYTNKDLEHCTALQCDVRYAMCVNEHYSVCSVHYLVCSSCSVHVCNVYCLECAVQCNVQIHWWVHILQAPGT